MTTAPTAVVTGGTRGIGRAVALSLAARGHRVVIVGRDSVQAEKVRTELAALSGNGAGVVVADLGSLAGVRAAAEEILTVCPRLDVLVHNAGVWPTSCELTEDGYERSFAVNHLAPFLLNHTLEGRLADYRARVVQVSAALHTKGQVSLESTPTGADFHPLRTYADTKLANLLLVPLFAQRWAVTGVRVNAVHPGVVRTGLGARGGVTGAVLKGVKLLWKSPRSGAAPVVELAVGERGAASGGYFERHRRSPLTAPAADIDLARELWGQAAEFTGTGQRP